jgi:hypothetical protein
MAGAVNRAEVEGNWHASGFSCWLWVDPLGQA